MNTFKTPRVLERERREKRRRRRLFLFMFLFMVFAIFTYFVSRMHKDDVRNIRRIFQRKPPFPDGTKVLHFLLLGIDPYDKPARTDTIIYARMDLENKVVYMLSVPRDSRVKIPEHGMDKINHAHVYGGTELTKKAVEGLLNVNVDHVVLTNIDAFVKAVDHLGGVEINVEKKMKYTDRRGGLYIDLKPGLQVLDGEKAMHYVRFRHDAEGDIGRIKRQQQFMKSVMQKAMSLKNLFKPARVTNVYKELKAGVEADLNFTQMAWLADFMRKLGPEHMHTDMVPGTPEMIGGISYWTPYQPGIERIFYRIEQGEDYYNRALAHVRILNRSGKYGMARKAKNALEDEGFDLFSTRTANAKPLDVSEVHYSEGKQKFAKTVSEILSVKLAETADIAAQENEPEEEVPDVELWLGRDFKLQN